MMNFNGLISDEAIGYVSGGHSTAFNVGSCAAVATIALASLPVVINTIKNIVKGRYIKAVSTLVGGTAVIGSLLVVASLALKKNESVVGRVEGCGRQFLSSVFGEENNTPEEVLKGYTSLMRNAGKGIIDLARRPLNALVNYSN